MREPTTIYGRKWDPVTPVHHRKDSTGTKSVEYTYSEVFVGDVGDNINFPKGGELIKNDRHQIIYQYRDTSPIMVKKDGPYKPDNAPVTKAERQAYFIMSILESKGLVSGWSK